jgi:hypothetical protein
MYEQSKAAKRRFNDGNFHNRFYVGYGVDIGGKPDPLANYVGVFPLLRGVKTWDLEDGDAQYMQGVADETFKNHLNGTLCYRGTGLIKLSLFKSMAVKVAYHIHPLNLKVI